MTHATLILLLLPLGGNPGKASSWSTGKQIAVQAVDQRAKLIADLGQKVWEYAELAFQETKSSKLLANTLEDAGFRVQRGVAGMATAFVAEYGKGHPIIAILGEFDALPGLSQRAVPVKDPDPRRETGHGCGHNLFGAASTGAALAVKEAIDRQQLAGTVRLYGCPAEEGGGGKVYMVKEGLFDDVDAALHWHPATSNSAAMRGCLAVIRFRVRFQGKSAHAAGAPHLGRSAMDGVELMNVGANYLREHIVPQARIHYVVTNGGVRPNVVPDLAEVWYYVRAPRMDQAQEIFERVKKIAHGAALMSETEHQICGLTGTYELLINEAMARVVDGNLRLIGPPPFTDEDRQFAEKLRQVWGVAGDQNLRSGAAGPLANTINKFGAVQGPASTDVGDVSWKVPTAGLRVATVARGIPGHSWGFVACCGTPMGSCGALTAAKVLAISAVELLEQPQLIVKAQKEHKQRAAGTEYHSVLDGPPPERLE